MVIEWGFNPYLIRYPPYHSFRPSATVFLCVALAMNATFGTSTNLMDLPYKRMPFSNTDTTQVMCCQSIMTIILLVYISPVPVLTMGGGLWTTDFRCWSLIIGLTYGDEDDVMAHAWRVGPDSHYSCYYVYHFDKQSNRDYIPSATEWRFANPSRPNGFIFHQITEWGKHLWGRLSVWFEFQWWLKF